MANDADRVCVGILLAVACEEDLAIEVDRPLVTDALICEFENDLVVDAPLVEDCKLPLAEDCTDEVRREAERLFDEGCTLKESLPEVDTLFADDWMLPIVMD